MTNVAIIKSIRMFGELECCLCAMGVPDIRRIEESSCALHVIPSKNEFEKYQRSHKVIFQTLVTDAGLG